MDNKELPQEIQDKIEDKASERYPQPKEVAELLMKDCFIDDMEEGAQIASEYYEPKLAEKDAKIKEQAEKLKEQVKQFVKWENMRAGAVFNESYFESHYQEFKEQHGI